MLQAIGDVLSFRDDRDAALAAYQQALDLFRAVGARLGEANVLQAIGQLYLMEEDETQVEEGASSLQKALELYQQIGDRVGQANTHYFWARFLAQHGAPKEAIPFAEEAYRLGCEIDPHHPVTVSLGEFATALRQGIEETQQETT